MTPRTLVTRLIYCRGDATCEPCAADADHVDMPMVPARKKYCVGRHEGRLRITYAAKSTPLVKNAKGQLVSARAKSGSSECSAAASRWRTGQAAHDDFVQLAQCRAMAKGKAAAHRQRAAGHEAKAQHFEHMINSGAPLGPKARNAKAQELKATRGAKGKPEISPRGETASPAPARDRSPAAARDRSPAAAKARIAGRMEAVGKRATEGDEAARRQQTRNAGRDTLAGHIAGAKEAGQPGYFGKIKAKRERAEAEAPKAAPAPQQGKRDRINALIEKNHQENQAAAKGARSVVLGNDEQSGFNRLIVHPSTREPGRYQLSRIAHTGEPMGHTTHDTKEEAISSASGVSVGGQPAVGNRSFRVIDKKMEPAPAAPAPAPSRQPRGVAARYPITHDFASGDQSRIARRLDKLAEAHVRDNPNLSPNRAREIAAAKIANRYRQEQSHLEGFVRQNDVPEVNDLYDRHVAAREKGNLIGTLQGLSGSRTIGSDIDEYPVKDRSGRPAAPTPSKTEVSPRGEKPEPKAVQSHTPFRASPGRYATAEEAKAAHPVGSTVTADFGGVEPGRYRVVGHKEVASRGHDPYHTAVIKHESGFNPKGVKGDLSALHFHAENAQGKVTHGPAPVSPRGEKAAPPAPAVPPELAARAAARRGRLERLGAATDDAKARTAFDRQKAAQTLREAHAARGAAPAPASATPAPGKAAPQQDVMDRIESAFEKHDARGNNFVTLHKLRGELHDVPRADFDAALRQLRLSRRFSLDSHEGLAGPPLTQQEKDAGVVEAGSRLVHASRNESVPRVQATPRSSTRTASMIPSPTSAPSPPVVSGLTPSQSLAKGYLDRKRRAEAVAGARREQAKSIRRDVNLREGALATLHNPAIERAESRSGRAASIAASNFNRVHRTLAPKPAEANPAASGPREATDTPTSSPPERTPIARVRPKIQAVKGEARRFLTREGESKFGEPEPAKHVGEYSVVRSRGKGHDVIHTKSGRLLTTNVPTEREALRRADIANRRIPFDQLTGQGKEARLAQRAAVRLNGGRLGGGERLTQPPKSR